MFSEATRRELEAERARLRRRLEAIDQILTEEGAVRRHAAPEGQATMAEGNGQLAGLGLREAAKKVLEAAAPKGLKPMVVAQRMEDQGFRSMTNATTPVVTRVRNELWRMAQKGDLRSVRGTYSLRRDEA